MLSMAQRENQAARGQSVPTGYTGCIWEWAPCSSMYAHWSTPLALTHWCSFHHLPTGGPSDHNSQPRPFSWGTGAPTSPAIRPRIAESLDLVSESQGRKDGKSMVFKPSHVVLISRQVWASLLEAVIGQTHTHTCTHVTHSFQSFQAPSHFLPTRLPLPPFRISVPVVDSYRCQFYLNSFNTSLSRLYLEQPNIILHGRWSHKPES